MDSHIYREKIMRTYESPLNIGKLEPFDFSHEDDNPLCGDIIRIDVQLDAQNRVKAIAWSGEGCIISQVTASLLTEQVKGMLLEEIEAFTEEQLLDLLGVTLNRGRIKCAILSLNVLKTGAATVSAN
jgi:nitrogen fixation protein NifU and related proteins